MNAVDRFGRSPAYDAVLNKNKLVTYELESIYANSQQTLVILIKKLKMTTNYCTKDNTQLL